MTHSGPLVVVGGGPAGMAAAIEAARAGVPCTLIDEARQLGGQVYRHPAAPMDVRDKAAGGREFARGERLRAEFASVCRNADLRLATSVLGIAEGRDVVWASEMAAGMIRAQALIIASGAYDRPVPFPGWALPGVMTAGGVQVLIKTMGVRPGRRALVTGTGPLIVGVARRLHEIGVDVVAVLEAADTSWARDTLPQEWDQWDLVKDTRSAADALKQAAIPILANHAVLEAHGTEAVRTAVYGPLNPSDWRPLRDHSQSVDVDLIVSGFGFVPNTELTVLAGCTHKYAHDVGGWIPVRDALMRTSVAGVLAAGDGAGVAGAMVAAEEGRVAGITAAEGLGALSRSEADKRRTAPLARLAAMAEVRLRLDEISRIRPGLLDLFTADTLACRCEEVSFGEVQGAVSQGAQDLQAIKLLTRLGMGPCQGRNCAPAGGMQLCKLTGRTPEQVGRINPRFPVKAVTLGVLASMTGTADVQSSDPLDAVSAGGAP